MRNLQARQRQRQDRESTAPLVPWRPLTSLPQVRLSRAVALVRLDNQMETWRAVWTFEPLDSSAASVRVLLCWRGEEWLALAPGRWRVTLAAGRPDLEKAFRYDLGTVVAEKGKAYELVMGGEMEKMLKAWTQPQNGAKVNTPKEVQPAKKASR